MALISVICPFCGGQAQIEDSSDALCPYCGTNLNQPSADQGFAFAQQPAPDMQFAQQPVQMQQTQPMQMQQPAAMPVPQMQGQVMAQTPQYAPAVLAAAQQKRKNWHILNCSLVGFQAMMMAFGILLTARGSRFGVPLILTWVLTTFGFGAITGLTRPDEAYIEKKPFNKSKFGAGVTQFWMGASISAAVGGILFAILAGLLGMY